MLVEYKFALDIWHKHIPLTKGPWIYFAKCIQL